jgi:hypothetical protein
MKSAWLLLPMAYVMATSPAAPSQALSLQARDILNTDRPLQPAEIAVALAATRGAVSGKTFRLSYVPNGPGPEVLMRATVVTPLALSSRSAFSVGWPPMNMSSPTLTNLAWNIPVVSRFTGFGTGPFLFLPTTL